MALPHNSHSAIVHCVAQIDTLSALVLRRFLCLLSSSHSSTSPLVQSVFSVSSQAVYSFTGYNYIYGARHLVEYSSPALCIANLIRNNIRYPYGVNSPCEGFISYMSC